MKPMVFIFFSDNFNVKTRLKRGSVGNKVFFLTFPYLKQKPIPIFQVKRALLNLANLRKKVPYMENIKVSCVHMHMSTRAWTRVVWGSKKNFRTLQPGGDIPLTEVKHNFHHKRGKDAIESQHRSLKSNTKWFKRGTLCK